MFAWRRPRASGRMDGGGWPSGECGESFCHRSLRHGTDESEEDRPGCRRPDRPLLCRAATTDLTAAFGLDQVAARLVVAIGGVAGHAGGRGEPAGASRGRSAGLDCADIGAGGRGDYPVGRLTDFTGLDKMAEINICETSAPNISSTCAAISRVVMRRANCEKVRSSIPGKRP
jgi:hypothetical protein